MAENLGLARLYLVLLAIVTGGRWLQGTIFHVPYEKGTHIFSIVTLTAFACIFYAAFCRRWLGQRLAQAVVLTMMLGLAGQVVVFLSTVVSYAFGIDSYFRNPIALNQAAEVGFVQALAIRTGGLVVNTLLSGILGALGWALGGALPASPRPV